MTGIREQEWAPHKQLKEEEKAPARGSRHLPAGVQASLQAQLHGWHISTQHPASTHRAFCSLWFPGALLGRADRVGWRSLTSTGTYAVETPSP